MFGKKSLWKRMGCLLALLCALLLGCACAEETGARFTIRAEDTVMAEEGLTLPEWEAQAEQRRQAALLAPATEETLRAAAPRAAIHRQNGRIYMIENISGFATVHSALDAYQTAYSLLPMLNGAEEASLRLWSVLEVGEKRVYVFQQVYEGMTLVAGTEKIVTDSSGSVDAVFSSLATFVPQGEGAAEITPAQAEDAVRAFLAEQGQPDSVQSAYTARAIIPVITDEETAEVLPDRLVWTVYSSNPAFAERNTVDLPYLAHFVGMDGAYLYNVPVNTPGDAAVQAGCVSAYAFEFMERAEWTGDVTDGYGETREMTVPVMRDTRTGTWFLADPDRRIAVGDFAKLAYDSKEVALVSASENAGWNDEDLITYANMIRVYDI